MKITANNINNLYSFSILLLLLFSGYVQSQTPISLELAYEKALNKNLEIQGGKLKIDYQEKLKNSTSMVDPLSVSGEIGQFNSENTDNKITVAQSFRLPNFYKNQKQVLVEDLKWASLSADVQKWQLKKQLALVYNHLLYQDEKEKLLQKTDSIFSAYYQRAILRLKKGESNVLEKTTAEVKRLYN
jgi:cobalt-zinc-cadmium efflux system outer membrane protein